MFAIKINDAIVWQIPNNRPSAYAEAWTEFLNTPRPEGATISLVEVDKSKTGGKHAKTTA